MDSQSNDPGNSNITRKEFIKKSGIALAGSMLLNKRWISQSPETPGRIALQLYTVRDAVKNDLRGTLEKVAACGYRFVETAFWPEGISVKQAAEAVKNAGLKVCSSHIELPAGDKKAALLEVAEAFDCKKMIWHGWPEDKRYSTVDGTKELAAIYNEANLFCKTNGLEFGLHNHWWEFRNTPGGRFVYEILLENLDKDIFFELDTYWIKVAGHDPAKIVARYGERAPFLHIKDGPAQWNERLPEDNPDPMVAVGSGSQNFPAIVKAAKGHTRWMVVEMDKTVSDVFRAIRDSYDYLVKNNLGAG